MVREKKQVKQNLVKKGFQQDQRDHHYLFYYTVNGEQTPIRTKISHSQKPKDLDSNLLSLMARQCNLSKQDFIRLIDCPMERNEYEMKMVELGYIRISNG